MNFLPEKNTIKNEFFTGKKYYKNEFFGKNLKFFSNDIMGYNYGYIWSSMLLYICAGHNLFINYIFYYLNNVIVNYFY